MKRKIKMLFSLVLALLLLCSVIQPVTAVEPEILSVFVASDIHYKPQSSLVPLGEAVELPGDELWSHANTKSMLTYEAEPIVDEFLRRFEESDSEILLIPGDISENGQWDEHLAIAEKLSEFKARTGKKIFVVPGNHDIRTSASGGRLDLADFVRVYAELGYNDALVRDENTASYTAELSDEYRLLAIDACIYREDGSRVSDELLAWIEQQVQSADADGKKLIGMVHHSLLEHFVVENVTLNMLCLENHRTLAEKFADMGIQYVFTGHVHGNDISSAVTPKGNSVFDIETGCLIEYPNAYREVAFGPENVRVETRYIDKIDISGLPDGYSAEQLEMIENDFPAYSYGYFRAGLRGVAYDLDESVEKIAKTLKAEPGTKQYAAIQELMDILSEALRLPMYDAGTDEIDSIEEIVALAGEELKESEYKDVIDVAAVLYAAHLAGDEKYGFDSVETELLFDALGGVLVYAFTNIPVRTANILFADMKLEDKGFEIKDSFYTLRAKRMYMKTATKIILREYLRPVADGFVNDLSAPEDLNVTLPAYGDEWAPDGKTLSATKLESFFRVLRALMQAFLRAMKALFVFPGG